MVTYLCLFEDPDQPDLLLLFAHLALTRAETLLCLFKCALSCTGHAESLPEGTQLVDSP